MYPVVEPDGNIPSCDLASSPTPDAMLMKTLLLSGLTVSLVDLNIVEVITLLAFVVVKGGALFLAGHLDVYQAR